MVVGVVRWGEERCLQLYQDSTMSEWMNRG